MFTSFVRGRKGILGALAAGVLALHGCGGGSDEPDARIGFVDADGVGDSGGTQPAATHEGTISVQDLTALGGDGLPLPGAGPGVRGGSISISFSPASALTACTGNGTAPCQVGTTSVNSCLSRVIPAAAPEPPDVYVGRITITTVGVSADAATPSKPIPVCGVRDGQYVCLSAEGQNGTFGGAANGGNASFVTGTVGDASVVDSDDAGRHLIVKIAGSFSPALPIMGVGGAGPFTLGLLLTAAAPAGTVDIWRIVAGAGPTPANIDFLSGDEQIRVSFAGNSSQASFFAPENNRTVLIGKPFTLDDESIAIIAKLDDESDMSAQAGGFSLGCSTPGTADTSIDCGGTNAAFGTLVVLDSTTAAGERVVTQCSAIGATSVAIPAAHWDLHKNRTLATMQATVLRPQAYLGGGTAYAPNPANGMRILAGHGFVANNAAVAP